MAQGIYRTGRETVAVGNLITFHPPSLPVFNLAQERAYIGPGESMLKRIVALEQFSMK